MLKNDGNQSTLKHIFLWKKSNTWIWKKSSYLKHVLQTCRVFRHYMWWVSKDVCHLLSSKLALLSEHPRHGAQSFHWKRQDPRVVAYHPLQTAWQTETRVYWLISQGAQTSQSAILCLYSQILRQFTKSLKGKWNTRGVSWDAAVCRVKLMADGCVPSK